MKTMKSYGILFLIAFAVSTATALLAVIPATIVKSLLN